jgi:hypothetical protein
MNEDEKLHRLLRLKRYEQPPEGYAEEFLEKFQRRQRAELMRRSALGIFWERLQAWMDGLRRPGLIWGAAAAYALLMLGFWLWPKPVPESSTTLLVAAPQPPANTVQVSHQSHGGTVPVNHSGDTPGKRRTTDQQQDKETVIGPENREPVLPAPPLRDL